MASLFNSNADRELWIRLNAERMIEFDKSLRYYDETTNSYKPTQQALNPRSMEEAMNISRGQCEIDEGKGNLRFTLEQLLTLDTEELKAISDMNFQIFWNGL